MTRQLKYFPFNNKDTDERDQDCNPGIDDRLKEIRSLFVPLSVLFCFRSGVGDGEFSMGFLFPGSLVENKSYGAKADSAIPQNPNLSTYF